MSSDPTYLDISSLNFILLQYIIMNLGMSRNFGFVDLEHLTFPATMRIDYIRVYQPTHSINIGCDPEDFPTEAYINQCVLEFVFFWGLTDTPLYL